MEFIDYWYHQTGTYRNQLSFAVFFNGIDNRQLKTVSEIISAHTGASKDKVNTALTTIAGGNANANGNTQIDNTDIQYSLTLVQGYYGDTYGEFEIWY